MVLGDARRAENRHGRPADPVDGLEALEELVRDPGDVPREVAVTALEESTVFH
jgi:hypothetical protein